MELEKIYKIIDDTVKEVKEDYFTDDEDMDMLSKLIVLSFCRVLKINLEEANKNEH